MWKLAAISCQNNLLQPRRVVFVSGRSLLVRWKSTTPDAMASSQLNCNKALIKAAETESFTNVLTQDVTVLQGIGPKHQEELHQLKLKKVADLANYKFYHFAKAIVVLAETETSEGRSPDAKLNINKGLDKAYETMPLVQLVEAPVNALQGLSEKAGERFHSMGVRTVGDLATFKYCKWAEAMQTAAKFEE